MRVLANGRISGVRDVVSGTPQGSGLSPLLFALFIFSLATPLEEHRDRGRGTEEEELKENELERKGRSSRTNVEAFLFAEDIKIIGSLFEETDMDSIQQWLELAYK